MADKECVLVVDDDKFNVALMRELCESAGYEVVEAHNGNEAIHKALSSPPDLILLDIMMAGKDGFEVCQELRSRQETAELPIIMVTALDDLESMARGIELGADDYVTKPFRLFELQQRLRIAIESRKYQRQLRDARQKLKELGESGTAEGVGGYRQLRYGMEYEFNRAMRYEHPLSCVLFTIDDYEDILEDKGREHAEGIVGNTIDLLKQYLRSVDRIYQLHDDEIILLLPETPAAGVHIAANRIQKGLREPSDHSKPVITITAGVVTYPHASIKSAQDILRTLNQLHSIAMDRGGNTIIELEK